MRTDSTDGRIAAGGAEIPALGFGTARMTGETCRHAIRAALDAGYRHIDTAQAYDNEDAVGDALEGSDVSREAVSVVTKLNVSNLARGAVFDSTRESLDRLRLDAVDLLLIHAPRGTVPIRETIGAMNDLQADGLVEHIGVSNFSIDQLETAREASESPIVTNQVRYHPYHHQDDLLVYCIDEGICLTAHTPLGEGAVVGDERLAAVGEPHGKSAAQVTLRWHLQHPSVATIPKAASRDHVVANADVFDFELSADEMRAVFDVGDGLSDALANRLEWIE